MNVNGEVSDEVMAQLPPDMREIVRRALEYKRRIKEGTSDPNNFMTLSEIELCWADLLHETKDQYSEITSNLLESVDEKPLISKKKHEYLEKYGISLRIYIKAPLTLLTLFGRVHFVRTVLRPATQQDKERLITFTGKKSVVPFDEFLGIDKYSYKMSPLFLLYCAYWAQASGSYEKAANVIREFTGNTVNTATVRRIANDVGRIVFEKDCQEADMIRTAFGEGKLVFPETKKLGTIYILMDGAMVNTLFTDERGSSWRENKLGLVFSSDNIEEVRNENNEITKRIIKKREYTGFIGAAEQFQWYLFDCAYRNGYGTYENTVILSDGAGWIANMASRLFPDATRILDLYHLKENVYKFAISLFNGDPKLYKPWAEDIINDIEEHGDWQTALTKIPKDVKLNNCVNLYNYIYNNRNSIDYPTYRKKGFIVGSGSIESGNKVVMQQRCKQSGMRWLVEFVQCMITLRVKNCSNIWLDGVVNIFLESIGQPKIEPGSRMARTLLTYCE